jgi:hypothetical protein
LAAKFGTIAAADLSRIRDPPLDFARIEGLFEPDNEFLHALGGEQ